MIALVCAAGFCAIATGFHLASVTVAAIRCRRRDRPVPPPAVAPPISLLRPVCGIDNFAIETLGSAFRLDYPAYEVLFCLARADDPAAPLVRGLIRAHPEIPARLLIGDDRVSANPKLNNVIKGWEAARHDWIVMADSNVLLPPDYLQRLLVRWRADTGLVCSMPIASRPGNFWAELECAFLNTFQARYQYFAESLGLGFAQGKSMLFRRKVVEEGGGIRALAAEIAEDAATTKLIRTAGLGIRLVDNPFEQPLGRRSAAQVWARQLRWARLRRMTFAAYFLPELLVGSAFPALAAAYLGAHLGHAAGAVAFLLALWLGAEMILARVAGWHFSARLALALLLRDLLLPLLWLGAWLGDGLVWRGTAMNRHAAAGDKGQAAPRPAFARVNAAARGYWRSSRQRSKANRSDRRYS